MNRSCFGVPQDLRQAKDADVAVLIGQGLEVEAGGQDEAEAMALAGEGDRDIGPAGLQGPDGIGIQKEPRFQIHFVQSIRGLGEAGGKLPAERLVGGIIGRNAMDMAVGVPNRTEEADVEIHRRPRPGDALPFLP